MGRIDDLRELLSAAKEERQQILAKIDECEARLEQHDELERYDMVDTYIDAMEDGEELHRLFAELNRIDDRIDYYQSEIDNGADEDFDNFDLDIPF